MKEKHIKLAIFFLALALIGVVGVTYSFFNYTRTSPLNNLGTGSINFSSNQGETLNLTNLFPMSSTEAQNVDLDTISISISGNTNYPDGEEFVVSVVEVDNQVYVNRAILSYSATYTPNTGKTIGSSSNDYWNDRNDKNANIYKLYSSGVLRNDKKILVGYIKNGETGIDGTLTIKTYIDKDKIAVSDTYHKSNYKLNTNMTESELNDCIDYFLDYFRETEENTRLYCLGIGKIYVETVDDELAYLESYPDDINELLEMNIIIDASGDGTDEEWRDGRTVMSTDEWNSIANTPVSLKVRVESNEGIWVNGTGTIDSCPNCKFLFKTSRVYTTWNTSGRTPTVLTTGVYDSYLDLMDAIRKDYFIGVVLNDNNQVTNAYTCAIKDNKPYCIEGKNNSGSKYEANKEVFLSMWDGCRAYTYSGGVTGLECGKWDGSGSLGGFITSDGVATFAIGYYDECGIVGDNSFKCDEWMPY